MSFDELKDRAEVLARLQIHAIGLTLVGAGLVLTGHKDEGMLVLGGAMALFKTHPSGE